MSYALVKCLKSIIKLHVESYASIVISIQPTNNVNDVGVCDNISSFASFFSLFFFPSFDYLIT